VNFLFVHAYIGRLWAGSIAIVDGRKAMDPQALAILALTLESRDNSACGYNLIQGDGKWAY